MMVKLKCSDAPILGVDPIDDVIAYIDKYTSTYLPTEDQDVQLRNLVKLQMHKHTNTCSSQEKICRFNYPRQASEHRTKFVYDNGNELKNNEDFKKCSSRKIALVYHRHQDHEFVNTYNPILLRSVRSNMDIQFCKSDWDTINYIVAYATKKEKELTQSLKALLENINSPVNHYTRDTLKLKALGNKFMNCRSISIQEAIMRSLPHLAMSNFSPQVMHIPSDMPEYRHGKLKSKKDLENLPNDSIDIFEKGIIDKYSNRPLSLHSLCYAEFAANYDPISKHKKVIDSDPQKVIQLRNGLGNMMLRKFPKTVRTYTPSESKDPERFYYSKLYLYFPWVNESELLGMYSTYKESFYHNENIIKKICVILKSLVMHTLILLWIKFNMKSLMSKMKE